jgi:phytoene/squalene synthetase
MIDSAALKKKLSDLRAFVVDAKNDREAVAQAVDKIINQFCDSRQARFHRMIMAFIHYLHEHDEMENFTDYLDLLKYVTGHCTKTMTEIKGDAVMFCKMKSISFGNCGQKDFESFAEEVKKFAVRKYQIDFDEWYRWEGMAIEKG